MYLSPYNVQGFATDHPLFSLDATQRVLKKPLKNTVVVVE